MHHWTAKRVRRFFEDGGVDTEPQDGGTDTELQEPSPPPDETPTPAAAALSTPPPPAPPPPMPPRVPAPVATPTPTHRVGGSMMGMALPESERLSARVVVVRGLNPGFFTGPGTNTYIVGTGSERALIDAGDHGRPDYVALLGRVLERDCAGARLSSILVTHSHPDHIGGVAAVVRAYGAPAGCVVRKVAWHGLDMGLHIEQVADGDVLRVDGETSLRALHTPGHAPDHVCWLLPEEQSVFSGDTVLGAGTVIIPRDGGDMELYFRSLRRLGDLDPQIIYPGHGPTIRSAALTIREYVRHRTSREADIEREVRGAPASGVRVDELVRRLYRDKPIMVPELFMAASETVHCHLVRLAAAGRVRSDAGRSRWFRGAS